MVKSHVKPAPKVAAVFYTLVSSSSPRAQKTLALINEICIEVASKKRDFSIANIAAICRKRGGPSAGAIRNKGGERYRTLIHAYAEAYPPPEDTGKQTLTSLGWIDQIPDNRQRWLAKEMERELRAARAQLTELRNMIKEAGPVIRLSDFTDTASQGMLPTPNLTETELRALKDSIDEQRLALIGLKADERGAIIDASNKKVNKIGFVSAIEKVLSVYSKDRWIDG